MERPLTRRPWRITLTTLRWTQIAVDYPAYIRPVSWGGTEFFYHPGPPTASTLVRAEYLTTNQGIAFFALPGEWWVYNPAATEDVIVIDAAAGDNAASAASLGGISANVNVQQIGGTPQTGVNLGAKYAALTPAAPAAVAVGVASGVLLAASATRRGLVLTVTTAGAYVSLGFGASAAVLYSGITLAPFSPYGFNEPADGSIVVAINAIASGAATNVAIQSFS